MNCSRDETSDGARVLGDEAPACPVCNCRAPARYAMGRDRLFGLAQGAFLLMRCPSCRCIFQYPLPTASALAGFYPKSYWWADDSATTAWFRRVLNRLERRYREIVTLDHVRFLERCAGGRGAGGRTLLDIGCGSGTFLHLARQRGFVVNGMDSSPRAVEIARRQFGLHVREGFIGDGSWQGFQFDFVTMFHVLEHIANPRLALRFAVGLLAPGGSLLIQVPNVDSVQARIFAAGWYGLDVPRHVINYSLKGLGILLQEAGLRIRRRGRFSLRDNPASLASSLVPRLDPLGRKGRARESGAVLESVLEMAYLGLFLAALPLALLESAVGYGGTIWVEAKENKLRC